MDTKIFIYTHKAVDYGVWENELYVPLEVGAARREPIYQCRDNVGDNISEWNAMYAENTGLYWLWKQLENSK